MGARAWSWPVLRGYAISLVATALALLLQLALSRWIGPRVPFISFWPAIALAAVAGGRGPGWLPLGAGLLHAAWGMPPAGSFTIDAPPDMLTLTLFVAIGALVVEFGARMRHIADRASSAEERLVMAIQGTGIGVFDIDLVSQTAYCSPALARLVHLPVSSGTVPLARWLERAPPELLAESRVHLAQRLRERARTYERELRIPQPDGGELWLLLRVHLSWSQDRAVRLRGACIDITDHKAIEARLALAQADLRQKVDDLDQLHELTTRLFEAATLPEQLQMILQTLARLNGARRGVVRLLDPVSGRPRVEAGLGFDEAELADGPRGEEFSVHSTPLLSLAGETLGDIALYFDETHEPTERERALADICARKAAVFSERARAQAALEETQGRFRAVLEASAVPFVVLDPRRDDHGTIVDFNWNYLNRAAAAVLQRSAQELVGRRVLEVMPASWKDSSAFLEYVAVAEKGEAREFETHSRLPSGEGWLHCVASPMRGSVAVWFNDITDRKRHEQILREADRRKDEFLATLAHELRNPLAPIRQAAMLSTSAHATEAQKRWSHEVIERQVQHMALLLDDLLDVSRITRGVLPLRKLATELGAVIASAVETARPAIDAMKHELEIDLPAHPERLQADPLRLAQVVANLLTNAAKYTDRGGRIRLVAQRVGPEIVIEVSDNGMGIAPESMPDIFRMFAQLHPAGEGSSAGLGIGLALSKGLVELHGGSIAVRSEGIGTGSTFTVRLPVGQLPAEEGLLDGRGAAAVPMSRKVLIADDNRDAADSLAALLQLDGHETRLSFDGEGALAMYEQFEPDVCLLDIGMPGRNGYEVARTIRQMAGGRRPVLIAITGWGQESDRHRALEAGFDHHLTKPVDPRRLAQLFG
ncbi:ATP-binding protein [Ideonella sp. YS5]|uniref:ATP-binding protein n=1 Tax=Ideonella sp. YS5 TaxID=3453714 RepID=UPI003EEEEDCE